MLPKQRKKRKDLKKENEPKSKKKTLQKKKPRTTIQKSFSKVAPSKLLQRLQHLCKSFFWSCSKSNSLKIPHFASILQEKTNELGAAKSEPSSQRLFFFVFF